jgi:hypothetical protein
LLPSDRTGTPTEEAPYGPHPDGIDEAAGGADSSPFETIPAEEREQAARERKSQHTDEPASGR